MGSVTYEDFAAIFGNPAESLRQVNSEAVKAAARGEARPETGRMFEVLLRRLNIEYLYNI